MNGVSRRRLLASLFGVAAVAALAGCGVDDADERESTDSDEDCDAGDLRENDPDCGYYDDTGSWVLYPWVVPGRGGKPPSGSRPKPPAGVSGRPPRGTSGGTSGGSRSGGGSRTGSGSGTRSGGGRR